MNSNDLLLQTEEFRLLRLVLALFWILTAELDRTHESTNKSNLESRSGKSKQKLCYHGNHAPAVQRSIQTDILPNNKNINDESHWKC